MTIRINYVPGAPWTIGIDTGNGTILGGISIDLYEKIFGLLNLKYTLKLQEDGTFGSVDKSGTWNGMVGSMLRNETDLAGPIFVSAERATVIDFSVPMAFTEVAVASGLVHAGRDPLLILRIFTMKVWLSVFLSLLISAGAATLIYRVFPSPHKKTIREALFRYIWAFYGTLLGKDFGASNRWFMDGVLAATSFRLLLSIWLLGPALVLMYTYQGAITSTFSSAKMRPEINSLRELDRRRDVVASAYKNSYPALCVKNLENSTLAQLSDRIQRNLMTPQANKWPPWLEDVAGGKLAFITEINILKDMIGMRFKETGRCGVAVTPLDICAAYISYGVRRELGSGVKKKFNKRLLWYTEGILYHRHLLASHYSYDACIQMQSATAHPLRFMDLLGAFLLYATGVSMSLFVFIMEKMLNLKEETHVK